MAIFSWISKLSPRVFSPKPSFAPAQENTWLKCTHDYATDFISDAFDEVISTVEMDTGTCDKLKKAIIENFDNYPRELRQATFIAVHGSAWSWPALEEWNNYFEKRGVFPWSWKEWVAARNNPPEVTFQDVCNYIRKEELKNVLNANRIDIPQKIKKSDMVQRGTCLGIEALRPHLSPDKWVEVVVRRQHLYEDESLYLLVMTIWRRAALLRNHRNDFKQNQNQPTGPQNHEVRSDDPAAQELCELWQRGELRGFPPFFPGDNSVLQRVLLYGKNIKRH